jgi:hypothetical protein
MGARDDNQLCGAGAYNRSPQRERGNSTPATACELKRRAAEDLGRQQQALIEKAKGEDKFRVELTNDRSC